MTAVVGLRRCNKSTLAGCGSSSMLRTAGLPVSHCVSGLRQIAKSSQSSSVSRYEHKDRVSNPVLTGLWGFSELQALMWSIKYMMKYHRHPPSQDSHRFSH